MNKYCFVNLLKLWAFLLLLVFVVVLFIATTLGVVVASVVLGLFVNPNWGWLAISLIFTLSFWIAFYEIYIDGVVG